MINTEKPISAVKYNGQSLPMAGIAAGVVTNEWKQGAYGRRVPKSITLHTNGLISAYQFANRNDAELALYRFVEEFQHIPHSPLVFIDFNAFLSCSWVTKEIVDEIFANVIYCNGDIFNSCVNIVGEIDLPNLEEINDYPKSQPITYFNRPGGMFTGCTGITKLSCPKLKNVMRDFVRNCTALVSVQLPRCQVLGTQNNGRGAFGNCSALESVQLGSIGTSCHVYTGYDFQNCIQNSLIITIYCTGDLVDSNLSFIRNGATNATIILKAAEATTYNGTEFAAGDTIITSTVETEGTT